MKKSLFVSILIIAIALISTACSKSSKEAIKLEVRAYIMNDSEEFLKPTVTLQENNKFTFVYSALSSYIPMGTYEIDNDKLILKTDNGKEKYIFKIDNGTLIFVEKDSTKLPSYANIPDGSIFE